MTTDLRPPLAPMEAQTAEGLPEESGWQYEPKWDGFRCLVFRDGNDVFLQSKSRPLARYFPEIVQRMLAIRSRKFVLDGELVIANDTQLSFDDLLLRLHPAESRVKKLSAEIPASYIAFDLLQEGNDVLIDDPLVVRRTRLEDFALAQFGDGVWLSPMTYDTNVARQWFAETGGGLDGIMAKLIDAPYASGERVAMKKVKHYRSADCVVGGFRYGNGADAKRVASLLLGLYDTEGRLHHVGFTSALSAATRAALTPQLEALVEPPGFTGRAPGGPSRWSRGRSAEWQPLAPTLVVEVEYDHFSGGRFRHGTSLLRWRPDKPARACTFDQVDQSPLSALALI